MNSIKDRAFAEGCPYFSSETQSCALPPGGIYFPFRIHVVNFCLTAAHDRCQTYAKYCHAEKLEPLSQQNNGEKAIGRRRHPRVPEKRKVLLRSSDILGIRTGDFVETAMTLDLSQGGMRVLLNREIQEERTFLFDFGDDFLVPRLQGIAEICWHRILGENPQIIEAGLAFKDNFSQAILSIELGN